MIAEQDKVLDDFFRSTKGIHTSHTYRVQRDEFIIMSSCSPVCLFERVQAFNFSGVDSYIISFLQVNVLELCEVQMHCYFRVQLE